MERRACEVKKKARNRVKRRKGRKRKMWNESKGEEKDDQRNIRTE